MQHTHHFSNAAAALRARKHVLCEKPVAVSSAELHELLRLAKENGVFLMEALWTRFQPIANAVKKVAEDPALGELRVLCVYAEGAMSGGETVAQASGPIQRFRYRKCAQRRPCCPTK